MNPYLNVWSTMLNIANRFAAANPSYNLTIMDFDENVAENEYPAGNLAGIFQLEYGEDDTMIDVTCVFPISVPADTELHVLSEIVGKFVTFVRRDTKHPFFDHASGQQIGLATARNSLLVSPVVNTNNRQFKYVMQSFGFDRTSAFLPT